MNDSVQVIPLARLTLAFIPVFAVLFIIHRWSLGLRTGLVAVFRMVIQKRQHMFGNLVYSLVEFGFARIPLNYAVNKVLKFRRCEFHGIRGSIRSNGKNTYFELAFCNAKW